MIYMYMCLILNFIVTTYKIYKIVKAKWSIKHTDFIDKLADSQYSISDCVNEEAVRLIFAIFFGWVVGILFILILFLNIIIYLGKNAENLEEYLIEVGIKYTKRIFSKFKTMKIYTLICRCIRKYWDV